MIKAIESDKFKIRLDESMRVHTDTGENNVFKVVDLEFGDYIKVQYSEIQELIELLKKAEDIF